MRTKVTQKEESVVLQLIGRLDTMASADFSTTVDNALAGSPKELEFDCSELEYVASSGLRVFLNAYKRLAATGGKIKLTHVKSGILDVLKLTGFTSFLTIEE